MSPRPSTKQSRDRCALLGPVVALAIGSAACAPAPTLAYRASRWQQLEATGCRIGTIEGAGQYERRCYQCPDGGKHCI